MSSSRLATMIIAITLLAGCTQPTAVTGAGSGPATERPTRPAAPPAATASPTPTAKSDLTSGKLNRRLSSGDVTVTVDYSTSLPIKNWTATATKPLRVTASADLDGGGAEKIYLSKLTVDLEALDGDGPVEPPLPLTDEAAIVPGFLISKPASYRQEFLLPGLVAGARTVTVRLRYELLLASPASGSPASRDYSRRTVTDLLTIPITAD